MDAPAASVRNASELLDVDVDQLAWPIALIAADWFSGCAVTGVEPAESFGDQNGLDCRAGSADFVADVAGAPAALFAEFDDPAAALKRCLVW